LKQKKLVIYFIITVMILLAILPIFNTSFHVINNTLNLKKFNKKYLFTTDNVESSINYYFYKNYKMSLNKNQVIVGKDNFLFLGNSYDKVIDKTQGKYPYTLDEINKWVQELEKLQDWYESRNIKFSVVLAPNKHTVYYEKLPDDTQYKLGKTITDDIVKLALRKNINILDLRSTFEEEKKLDQLYFTTDTHWNSKGASLAFEATIKFINSLYGLKYEIPKYNLSNSHRGSGDLADFLKIKSFLPNDYEKDYDIDFKHDHEVCHGNIDKKHKLEKCISKMNPIMGINSQDQYMINKYSANKNSLLLLCDSFGTANSQLYNATFSTIWKFHYGHIEGKNLASFVNEHKPDIVIYQIVERGFYNQGIIKNPEQ